ncbi:MAG: hydantoinase/oxoprolinase N-terminal domain-containing protein, partial [Phycisphaerales bacterium]
MIGERGHVGTGGWGAGPVWRIWVDTGGTFTDCLAVDPAGAVHRAKVLSSSALRGRIVGVLDGGRARVEQGWGRVGRALEGMAVRGLGQPG